MSVRLQPGSGRPTWVIMVSLYCFFCVTLIGGCLVTAETRKFIRMSSQLRSCSHCRALHSPQCVLLRRCVSSFCSL
uniref:Uncharacterized protein n=1 Tax=Monopterus albus TaxID=43700 RepID=A0A3Q3J0K4_MONAL